MGDVDGMWSNCMGHVYKGCTGKVQGMHGQCIRTAQAMYGNAQGTLKKCIGEV